MSLFVTPFVCEHVICHIWDNVQDIHGMMNYWQVISTLLTSSTLGLNSYDVSQTSRGTWKDVGLEKNTSNFHNDQCRGTAT